LLTAILLIFGSTLDVQNLRFLHLGCGDFQFPVYFVFGKCIQRRTKVNSVRRDDGIAGDIFDGIHEITEFDKYFTKIDIPVFPRYRQCTENFLWPIGKFFDETRELIVAHKFRERTLLKTNDHDRFVMYSRVFYDDNLHSRLQIIFDFPRNGCPMLDCTLDTCTKKGKTIVTNNLQTVFACLHQDF
jgi:hypothetical protein